jgi:hypothetical protein
LLGLTGVQPSSGQPSKVSPRFAGDESAGTPSSANRKTAARADPIAGGRPRQLVQKPRASFDFPLAHQYISNSARVWVSFTSPSDTAACDAAERRQVELLVR